MNKRKTVDVRYLINYVNHQLSREDDEATLEFKQGLIAMIDAVLHDTGNYSGFCYVNNETVNTAKGAYSRFYYVNSRLLHQKGWQPFVYNAQTHSII